MSQTKINNTKMEKPRRLKSFADAGELKRHEALYKYVQNDMADTVSRVNAIGVFINTLLAKDEADTDVLRKLMGTSEMLGNNLFVAQLTIFSLLRRLQDLGICAASEIISEDVFREVQEAYSPEVFLGIRTEEEAKEAEEAEKKAAAAARAAAEEAEAKKRVAEMVAAEGIDPEPGVCQREDCTCPHPLKCTAAQRCLCADE